MPTKDSQYNSTPMSVPEETGRTKHRLLSQAAAMNSAKSPFGDFHLLMASKCVVLSGSLAADCTMGRLAIVLESTAKVFLIDEGRMSETEWLCCVVRPPNPQPPQSSQSQYKCCWGLRLFLGPRRCGRGGLVRRRGRLGGRSRRWLLGIRRRIRGPS